MFWQFYKRGKEQGFWQPHQTIVVAVSGGVDSMALLTLMEQVAEKEQLQLVVAHVNHQLREASAQEAQYLATYCQQRELTYYETRWEDPEKQRNLEAKARTFRYEFFKEVMEIEGAAVLMTAHHLDDQAETILMKLIRGTNFSHSAGIKERRPFATGELIRPLLIYPKEELYQFAQRQAFVYFEDETNQTNEYLRNRLRNQVLPLLKQENPQFLDQIASFSNEQRFAQEFIQEQIEPQLSEAVEPTKQGWRIPLKRLLKETPAYQHFFLTAFFQKTLVPLGVSLNQRQMTQILKVLNDERQPQGSVMLEQQWQLAKSYDWLCLEQKQAALREEVTHLLVPGAGIYLSETEWLGLIATDKPFPLPEEINQWTGQLLAIPLTTATPLTVRHRQSGDRITLKPGFTKKLSRVFIDQKVPNEERESAWVITDEQEEIIWVPKFANSYLSIPLETDKIHYRLLFKTKE